MKLTALATAVAVALPLAAASAARADAISATLEAGYTRTQFEDIHPDYAFNTVQIRGGVQLNTYWGAEMEANFGTGSDRVNQSGFTFRFKQNWAVGTFLVGYAQLGHHIDLIGRIGYTRTQLAAYGAGHSLSTQLNAAAVGIGIRQFPGGGNNGYRFDYTRRFYQGSPEDSLGATYVHRF
jgi:hypothetical protein